MYHKAKCRNQEGKRTYAENTEATESTEDGGHREHGEGDTNSVRVDNKKALTTGESIRKTTIEGQTARWPSEVCLVRTLRKERNQDH